MYGQEQECYGHLMHLTSVKGKAVPVAFLSDD